MIPAGSVSFKNTALKQISPLWSRLAFLIEKSPRIVVDFLLQHLVLSYQFLNINPVPPNPVL